MAIQRYTKRIPVGDGQVKHRTTVVDDPSPPGKRDIHFQRLLRALADDTSLLACGFQLPQRVVIEHNGTSWQVIAEAEAPEETG